MHADQVRKLVHDIAVHPIVRGPGRLGGVDIESGAESEVPRVVVAGQARRARAGVGRDEDEPQFGRDALRTGLDGEGLLGAGEAGEVIEHRQRPRAVLRWPVNGKAHGPRALARGMLVEALHAAETGMLGEYRQRGFSGHRE